MAKKRFVYSVRRARKNLLEAIRAEVETACRTVLGLHHPMSRTTSIYAREAAVRDLIASVRAERTNA